jgi:hypothetical protein
MGELKVDPRDLLRVSESYRELGLRAQLISPQAATEVQRISESHGPMGYPTAVGIAAGMANAEGPLNAKVADFHEHAGRFEEHAATYSGQDQDNAKKYSTADLHTDKPRTPGSSGGGVQAVDWKPGDPRHRPYIAGPNGLGPSQHGDLKWVEVGPRSGNFVRSDEVPGIKVQAPGELGPATVSDSHGNPDPYIELGPNSGVWAPKSDFPGAKFYPPGSSELPPYGWDEYLPGSGIFLWHGDLKAEPFAPGGGGGATYPAG